MREFRRWTMMGAVAIVISVTASAVLVKLDQPTSREERLESLKQELLRGYDTSNRRFNPEELLAPGVAKDAIPALTMPNRTMIPAPTDRVVEVVIGGSAVAYPLNILNWHEIVNDSVAGVPIAVTYCPLCDSVSVFDRRLTLPDGSTTTLEFGVSGLLYNSNVVMYERTTNGLWSQVMMEAISGPHAGKSLTHLPVRVVSFAEFQSAHPFGEVLSTQTGHERDYVRNPYEGYLKSPTGVFHKFKYDDRLPPKELGLGIVAGDRAFFVRASATLDAPLEVATDLGVVRVAGGPAGLRVLEAPEGARTVQTFYHSFAAFHPGCEIVPSPSTPAEGG